ncbi:MAG: rhomboid family intramembrane serine protease [Candidatus Brocadiales bacterium]
MKLSETLGFRLTPIIAVVLLNLMFFLVTFFANRTIFIFGLSPANFTEQPWAIVTSMFVYISFWHLIINMIPLYFLGTRLSQQIGNNKFLLVYFLGGISGNVLYFLISLLLPDNYLGSLLIGSSGPIFAIGGVLIVMMGKMGIRLFFSRSDIPLYVFVLVFFLILSLSRYASWEAHLGGLLFGLVIGYFFRRVRNKWQWDADIPN